MTREQASTLREGDTVTYRGQPYRISRIVPRAKGPVFYLRPADGTDEWLVGSYLLVERTEHAAT